MYYDVHIYTHLRPFSCVLAIIGFALCLLVRGIIYVTYEKQWNIYALHCLSPISVPQEGDHDKDSFIRAYVSRYESLNRIPLLHIRYHKLRGSAWIRWLHLAINLEHMWSVINIHFEILSYMLLFFIKFIKFSFVEIIFTMRGIYNKSRYNIIGSLIKLFAKKVE